MNDIIKNLLLLPFLLMLVMTLGLGIQFSIAGTKNSESDLEQSSDSGDSSDEQTEDSSETDSEEVADNEDKQGEGSTNTDSAGASDTEADETVPSEGTANDTSTTPSLEPTNTTTGNVTASKQFSTKNQADVLGGGVLDAPPSPVAPTYKVKVTFDSITVHDDREGTFSGDGEFDLYAYVHGKKVGLTDATSGYVCSGVTSTYKCLGLMDVHPGQRLTFNEGTEVTLDLLETTPFRIVTVGVEVDGCGRLTLPDYVKFPDRYNLQFLDECEVITETTNQNDHLGWVDKNYDPTDYGAGSHAEKSGGIYGHDYNNPDYTLRYTITVTPPPNIEKKQIILGTNNFSSSTTNFSSQLNNDFSAKSLTP